VLEQVTIFPVCPHVAFTVSPNLATGYPLTNVSLEPVIIVAVTEIGDA